MYIKEKEICPAYISKADSNCGKKIILMVLNEEKEGWDYLAVKKLPAILKEITFKHYGDFYCLNCLNSFRTENKPKSNEKLCQHKNFFGLQCHQKRIKFHNLINIWSEIKCVHYLC